MADNTPLNLGVGGDIIRNIDNAGVKMPVTAIGDALGAIFAAVKAASTAAVASDSALVVAISPNNSVSIVENDLIASGSLTALGSVTLPTLNGVDGTAVQITGTWVGTVTFEGSIDGTNFFVIGGTSFNSTGAIVTSTTANGSWQFDAAGLQLFRARCSAFTSGTIAISVRGTSGCSLVALDAPVSAPTLTKGTQGSTGFSTQDLKDSGRNVCNYFSLTPANIPTTSLTALSMTGYKNGAAVTATTLPAVVTTGKTYRITNITINAIATTTAGYMYVALYANPSGLATNLNQLVETWVLGVDAFTAAVGSTINIDFPDGFEFPAGTGLAVYAVGYNASNLTTGGIALIKVNIHGFEY